jgi:hypothetical protein
VQEVPNLVAQFAPAIVSMTASLIAFAGFVSWSLCLSAYHHVDLKPVARP